MHRFEPAHWRPLRGAVSPASCSEAQRRLQSGLVSGFIGSTNYVFLRVFLILSLDHKESVSEVGLLKQGSCSVGSVRVSPTPWNSTPQSLNRVSALTNCDMSILGPKS